jgi:hypothetical protein
MTVTHYNKVTWGTSSEIKLTVQQSLLFMLSKLLCMTPLQFLPVRVRRGLAKGARWTLLPHYHYWRFGGESDIVAAMKMFGNINVQAAGTLGRIFVFIQWGWPCRSELRGKLQHKDTHTI